ncbi:MAG: DUF2490 domain-containing protein [Bacteroidota bacterium]
MNINHKLLFLGLITLLSLPSYAQSKYEFGTLPSFNLNKGLGNDWALNFSWQSRQIFSSGEFGGESRNEFDFELSDITLITSKKVGLNNNIAAGYVVRFRSNEVIHRLTQRFTIVRKYTGFRLAHRFVTDQTFSDDAETVYRLRYRMSIVAALNGLSVDAQEFYFKFNNEYLNSWEGEENDLEIRLIPLLGYVFNDNNKLETGLDYRLDSFINEPGSDHVFWINIGWYYKID